MATVVQFKYIKPLKTVNEKAKVHLTEDINNCVVGKPVNDSIRFFILKLRIKNTLILFII